MMNMDQEDSPAGPMPVAASTAPGTNSRDSESPVEMPERKRCRLHAKRPTTQAFPKNNMLRLLLERQKRGGARFVSREGAGTWSPDPLQCAVGAQPHYLRKMKLSGELRGHRGCVNTVTATPDGKYWITGSDDMKLKIWDCESHLRKMSFDSGHENNIFQARALPFTDNEKIVTCAADGQVRLTNLSRMMSSRKGIHGGPAHRIAIEPGSPHRFMSCGEDGVVLTYDLRSQGKGTPIVKRADCNSIKGMALNPHEPNYFFVCGDSPALDMYDTRKVSRPAARFCPDELRHSRGTTITGCAVNWCGSEVVATYNPAGAMYRFEVKRHAQRPDAPFNRRGNRRLVRQRTPSRDGDGSRGRGASSAGESADGRSGRLSASGSGAGGCGAGGSDERDGAEDGGGVADGAGRSDADVVSGEDVDDHEERRSYATKYSGHRNILTVKQVTFYGPRSEYVVSGSDCGHIFMWDKTRGDLEMLMWGDKVGAVNCLEPHPYLPTLATSGLSKTAKIWRPVRHEAVALGKLAGKEHKTAKEVIAANKEYAERRAQQRAAHEMTVDPSMLLSILDVFPDTASEDDEGEGSGGRAAAGAADRGSGGEAGSAGGRNASSNRRPRLPARTFASLLELVARAPVVLPMSDNDSDNDSQEEGKEEEEEEEKEEEEEEDEEEDEDDDVPAVSRGVRPGLQGRRDWLRWIALRYGRAVEEGDDDEEDEEEDNGGHAFGPAQQAAGTAAPSGGGLSREVVSSEEEGGDTS